MKKKLNFISPIGYTGYGITSFNILKNIDKKCEVALFCLSDLRKLNLNDEKDADLIRRTFNNNKFFDSNSPNLKIWHPNDLSMRAGKGDFYVFPFFEIDYIPEIDRHHINSCDHIFTASKWGKEILLKNDINIGITVCPLGVDADIFYEKQDANKTDKYVFFHIGKWEKRKSQDILLKCFERAFSVYDNVELWLFPHNPFLSQEENDFWYQMVDNNKLKEKIKIFPRLPTQHDINNAINLGDCGVFISRAEGWNNEIMEAMAVNRPVICSNYSAHTEYCTKDNCFLVDIEDVEPANDGKWFFGEGNWAKIDKKVEDNIIDHMKFVYKNDIRTNINGLRSSKNFSWENTSKIIENTIYANT
jgi:glycosyltransferase involved in cell wall biosynthesis